MSQKSNHTSTMANDDNCDDVSDYNSFFPNVLDFLEEDEIQTPSHKSTGMKKWTNQYCWNGKNCYWSKCKRMHPGLDKCISPSCLDMGCMKIHDTTTGWSCKRDESSREKILQKIQSSCNVPIKEQCSGDQYTEILNTAFCAPKGINSVKIIINGKEIVLGPESIAPVMDVLCKQGYWQDA
jgi:hypothetical protein